MPDPFRLRLPQSLYRDMVAQAVAELPNECCGLLAGTVADAIGLVRQRYPLLNATADPRLFESDAKSMFAAVRDMDNRGFEVLAVYHSHPSAAPIPSRTDLERNYSPDVVNLIISLQGREPEVRGWWLSSDDFRQAAWEVVET
jgi:[CysO sulfur-carrier protein]-S-L-cysteine hydrolase